GSTLQRHVCLGSSQFLRGTNLRSASLDTWGAEGGAAQTSQSSPLGPCRWGCPSPNTPQAPHAPPHQAAMLHSQDPEDHQSSGTPTCADTTQTFAPETQRRCTGA